MSKKPIKKPIKKSKEYYDYNECRNYLQEKYSYDERDYAGKYTRKKCDIDKDAPYLDFWHWVLDNYTINNGCFICFTSDTLNEIQEDWVKEIYTHYLEEFGENSELEMYVWW